MKLAATNNDISTSTRQYIGFLDFSQISSVCGSIAAAP